MTTNNQTPTPSRSPPLHPFRTDSTMATTNLNPPRWNAWNEEQDEATAYRYMWTRETDPLFGDDPNAKKLFALLHDFLQPYQHSGDRFFPPAAEKIPGLTRYIPTFATIDYYRSASRGPACYDRTNKRFTCHMKQFIPAFMYT